MRPWGSGYFHLTTLLIKCYKSSISKEIVMILYLYRVPELEAEEENQVQEMTLDEWKNLQEQTRPKPEFNIRKPESTVPSKAVVIHKSKYRDDVSKPSVLGEYVPLPSSGTIRPLLVDVKTEPSVWGVWCGGQRRRVVLSTEAIRFGTHLAISSPSTWQSCFCSGLTKGDGKEWNLVCWQENTAFSAGLESKPGRHKCQGFRPPWPLRGTEQLFQRLLFWWLDCRPLVLLFKTKSWVCSLVWPQTLHPPMFQCPEGQDWGLHHHTPLSWWAFHWVSYELNQDQGTYM